MPKLIIPTNTPDEWEAPDPPDFVHEYDQESDRDWKRICGMSLHSLEGVSDGMDGRAGCSRPAQSQ